MLFRSTDTGIRSSASRLGNTSGFTHSDESTAKQTDQGNTSGTIVSESPTQPVELLPNEAKISEVIEMHESELQDIIIKPTSTSVGDGGCRNGGSATELAASTASIAQNKMDFESLSLKVANIMSNNVIDVNGVSASKSGLRFRWKNARTGVLRTNAQNRQRTSKHHDSSEDAVGNDKLLHNQSTGHSGKRCDAEGADLRW